MQPFALFSANKARLVEARSTCLLQNAKRLKCKLFFVQSHPLSLIALPLRLSFIDRILSRTLLSLLLTHCLLLTQRKLTFITRTKSARNKGTCTECPGRCDHFHSAVHNHGAVRHDRRRTLKKQLVDSLRKTDGKLY